MPDITWPVDGGYAFWPDAHDEALEYQVELTVKRNGGVETLSLPGARWTSTLRFAEAAVSRREERARLQAFLATLRGGANRLLLWNLAQPEPLGNARGAVTLAAGVAAGATSAQLLGCAAFPNRLLAPTSFWVAPWVNAWGGSASITPDGGVDPQGGTNADFFQSLSGGSAVAQAVTVQTGVTYTFSVWVLAGTGVNPSATFVGLQIRDGSGGAAAVLASSTLALPVPSTWYRGQVTWTSDRNGVVHVGPILTTTTTAGVFLWGAQFEAASAATPFAGLPRLLRGDRLAWDGQRVLVTADATATDAGAMNVQFEPARRAASLAGAAVTLVRPATRYVVTSPVVPMPAVGTVLPGFAIELVEA